MKLDKTVGTCNPASTPSTSTCYVGSDAGEDFLLETLQAVVKCGEACMVC